METGVYQAEKKDGTRYYRSSITYKNKHISLGSFSSEADAGYAYRMADSILHDTSHTLESFDKTLSFKKWVTLINFRDNGIYIKTPIYLCQNYFRYYFSPDDYYIFDIDDLFYFSTHSIMRRGGHLFVSDYGMQINILSRYGIKNYAVSGRDFLFVNGNKRDFRYENIEIINRYQGVQKKQFRGKTIYETRIHLNGDLLVGRYQTETEAAIAYNKAASELIKKGYEKNYPVNYLEELSTTEYKEYFKKIKVSKSIRKLEENKSFTTSPKNTK
ncbi:MAG: hypothetical protein NC293_02635 [Roseburia sp.]|nr:hypothetical protein [Roseburia sp.]